MEENKRNLLYFEANSMRELYQRLDEWQRSNEKRLLSVTIHQDGTQYCCIALSNPTEVLIVDPYHKRAATIDEQGRLKVHNT